MRIQLTIVHEPLFSFGIHFHKLIKNDSDTWRVYVVYIKKLTLEDAVIYTFIIPQ